MDVGTYQCKYSVLHVICIGAYIIQYTYVIYTHYNITLDSSSLAKATSSGKWALKFLLGCQKYAW